MPGIIPACAGSSRCRRATKAACGDHPRVCGEQPLTYQRPALPLGSSPRVRGAGLVIRDAEREAGIIPARAGSRERSRGPAACSRDHPRVCGEQHSYSGKVHTFQGSSPRGRGVGVLEGEHRLRRGIIPAHAGSSSRKSASSSTTRDHPRACGEQEWHHTLPFGTQGSPPRVRGAGRMRKHVASDFGIIPACAGSSPSV